MQNKLSILLSLVFLISLNSLAMEQRDGTNQPSRIRHFNTMLRNFDSKSWSDRNDLIAAYCDLTEDEQSEIISSNPDLKSILNLDDDPSEDGENEEDMQVDSSIPNTNAPIKKTNSNLQTQNSKFEPMDITSDEAATILEDTTSRANVLSNENEELNKALEKASQEYTNLVEKNKQILEENKNLQNQIFELNQKINDSKQQLSTQADARTARACQILVKMNHDQRANIEKLKKLKDDLLKNLNN